MKSIKKNVRKKLSIWCHKPVNHSLNWLYGYLKCCHWPTSSPKVTSRSKTLNTERKKRQWNVSLSEYMLVWQYPSPQRCVGALGFTSMMHSKTSMWTIAGVRVCNFKEKQQSSYSSIFSNPCIRWDGGHSVRSSRASRMDVLPRGRHGRRLVFLDRVGGL